MTHTPAAPRPAITFAEHLPVSARRAEIEAALAAHQVLIVCGETGSGKTTQLPKMALAIGRGRMNAPAGVRGKLIGHTQPRRIAATSVARRIADELQTPLGEVVGYKVRFNDRLSPNASVKLMTDGILLAETQTDPLLQAYDTLIIDEAHERSLNIDFLLGYLKQILPRRPDLKLIVTSATIDAERFARHFADGSGQPAPVFTVSGRTYPVEQRWRPFEESRDYGLNHAIADALDELWAGPPSGDVLVFLPGEREIREAADHLRRHLAHKPATRSAEVLPLFARLGQAEQDRIFAPHGAPRVVLATNVAETSLTVPGIKYVIDAGTARVKRYSLRSKVEQLLVEPISQAAANQRAGRCGRVGNGVCIRLYDEKDFAARPAFTDPEILRSSLAAVILRMKALGLGGEGARMEDFPFLDAPSGRAIADGYQLLAELGALDAAQQLTALGRELARLPLDPRVGRMLVEARGRGALREMLVIAAALSVPDVRERPIHAQAQADQAHAKFDDEKSEFSGYLRLWQWLHDAREGRAVARTRREMQAQAGAPQSAHDSAHANTHAHALPTPQRPPQRSGQTPAQRAEQALAQARRLLQEGERQTHTSHAQTPLSPHAPGGAPAATHRISNRQWESLLRENHISIRRVREWRDIHTQLHTVVAEHKWLEGGHAGAPAAFTASYEAIHKSLLAGLLGNIGCKLEEGQNGHKAQPGAPEYLGARGVKFHRHPGAHLSKRPGKWIVCAELVETARLFGRTIANIEPQWLEELGAHLLKKQLLEPHWDKRAQDVLAFERATLHGLTVYSGRRKSYAQADAREAREIFIRQALVAGMAEKNLPEDWPRRFAFLAANARTIARVQELEHKSRRQDVLVDEELIFAFYDAHVPQGISNGRDFEAWWRQASRANPALLTLTQEELMRHEAAGITAAAFPKIIRLGGVDCTADYLHQPGDARDGLSVAVPLFALNQISEARCEWLVPGMLKDKVQALLKSLPQKPRSRFVPLPASAERLAAQLAAPDAFGHGSLLDALLKTVRAETGLDVKRTDFKPDMLPAHLFMHLRVVDEHGRQLGAGRSLAALKAELGGQARGAFQALAALKANLPAAATAATPDAKQKTAPAPAHRADAATKSAAQGSMQGTAQNTVASTAANTAPSADTRHTAWDFGELPELMEIRRKGQTLIGFPALADAGDAVTIEVFDEPDVATARHRAGLRRLFALQVRDTLRHLEKNIPDLQKMAVAYMQVGRSGNDTGGGTGGGTAEELRGHIIDLALERAFLAEPLPANQADFARRTEEGRARLVLIAGEVARLAAQILAEHAAAARKVKDAAKTAPEAARDAAEQTARLVGRRFLAETPWAQLQHLPRYLKAVQMRFDKLRADPARDSQRMHEARAQEQRLLRRLAERRGVPDARLQELRWLIEELRVSLFAQELRTPQPVSAKRLEKIWAQIG